MMKQKKTETPKATFPFKAKKTDTKEAKKQNTPFPFPPRKTETNNNFPPKQNTESNIEEDHDCSKCNNIPCKCQLILLKLEEVIDLAQQIEHFELSNIVLTVFHGVKNLQHDEHALDKIVNACQETYSNLRPTEMGITLN